MSGIRRGGNHAIPARLPQKVAEDYTVRQLKGKLSSAGIENAGVTDKKTLAEMAVKAGVI